MASPLLWERVSALEARVDRLEALLIAFRDETRQRFDAVDHRLDQTHHRLDETNRRLDETTRRLDETTRHLDETNRRIGVLHEDVIARIATIGEQRNGRSRKRHQQR